jgi:hypothetical protein
VGAPGGGGVSGSSGGSPNQAPPGATGACSGSGGCPALPIVIPAVALLSGHHINAQFQCHSACHGTVSLHFMATGSAKSTGALLAKLSFTLRKKAVSTLVINPAAGALAKLAHSQALMVQLTVTVAAGHAQATTIVSPLELTRKLPATAHKTKSARASALHRA